ncbi:nectin-1-like [Tautogolabrus adspersus]
MGCSGLLILVLIPNIAHCLEILGSDGEPHLDIPHNITAVLGEDVYLWCRYMGESEILSATWKRQINTKVKSRPLAGFTNDEPFSRFSDFSEPESGTNLTVKMSVSSVDAEGEYICEFESEEASYSDSVFLTVVARPEIQIQLSAETINGSHYQSVSCSAVGGRPVSKISWLVDDLPSPDHPLTQHTIETVHPNGTSTVSSTLRFPTHLQDQESVVCIVQHPTLPSPTLTTVRVEHTVSSQSQLRVCVVVFVFLHLCCLEVTDCIASPLKSFCNHAS